MAYSPKGETRARVLAWVRKKLLAGEAPSTREVQEHFAFSSVQSARAHLEALVAEGALTKAPGAGRARSYRLPPLESQGVGKRLTGTFGARAFLVPLLGRVQAGALSSANEELEGYLTLMEGRGRRHGPVETVSRETFALRVRGESMRDAGILEGDVVIVKRQQTARSGEIVVALVDDEATVKTLRRAAGCVILEPANPAFSPLSVDPEAVKILGKVVEVRRYLEGSLPLIDLEELA